MDRYWIDNRVKGESKKRKQVQKQARKYLLEQKI